MKIIEDLNEELMGYSKEDVEDFQERGKIRGLDDD